MALRFIPYTPDVEVANNTANQRSTATGSASPTAATTTASAEAASQPPRNVYFATVTANGALGPNRNGVISAQNYGGAGCHSR